MNSVVTYRPFDRMVLYGIGFVSGSFWFLAGMSAMMGLGWTLFFLIGLAIMWLWILLFYAEYAIKKVLDDT